MAQHLKGKLLGFLVIEIFSLYFLSNSAA